MTNCNCGNNENCCKKNGIEGNCKCGDDIQIIKEITDLKSPVFGFQPGSQISFLRLAKVIGCFPFLYREVNDFCPKEAEGQKKRFYVTSRDIDITLLIAEEGGVKICTVYLAKAVVE